MNIPLSPCVPENLVSRDGFSRPVPRQSAHLHTQAESGAYLRDSSRVPRRRPFMKPPYAIGSVPSLSGHAVAYRWRSLPRVRRHRASKPQGRSERVLPWQITMDQLIFASLSHTHYWYEVGMLKVPADSRLQLLAPSKNYSLFKEKGLSLLLLLSNTVYSCLCIVLSSTQELTRRVLIFLRTNTNDKKGGRVFSTLSNAKFHIIISPYT